jgi:hypothetical protein
MCIYLYVKTHNKTGLKYLGRTIRKDPHKYTGSGVYWLRHLRQHGVDYTTEIIKECQTMEEIAEWGMHYSALWNVVDSPDWANLMPEDGTGNGKTGVSKARAPLSLESRQKISNAMKGRPAHNKGKKQPRKPHKPYRKRVGVSPLRGRVRPRIDCPHCGRSIDEVNYKRYHGDKCKTLFVS